MSSKKETRKRNWAFIVYPESAPDNWQEILREHLVPTIISPLHEKDINATGEPKKPHWHVIVKFPGLKNVEQVREICQSVNGTEPQHVKDLRSYCRYLCHLDNPEKSQYSIDDVVTFGGVDYFEIIKSEADETEMLDQILDWVNETHCYSFKALVDYSRKNQTSWFRLLRSKHTIFIAQYLRSFQWEEENS